MSKITDLFGNPDEEAMYQETLRVPLSDKIETVDDLWNWWMSDKSVNDTDQPDCQMYLW
jgi:hypothetical protein